MRKVNFQILFLVLVVFCNVAIADGKSTYQIASTKLEIPSQYIVNLSAYIWVFNLFGLDAQTNQVVINVPFNDLILNNKSINEKLSSRRITLDIRSISKYDVDRAIFELFVERFSNVEFDQYRYMHHKIDKKYFLYKKYEDWGWYLFEERPDFSYLKFKPKSRNIGIDNFNKYIAQCGKSTIEGDDSKLIMCGGRYIEGEIIVDYELTFGSDIDIGYMIPVRKSIEKLIKEMIVK